jgi:anti-sigma factor ChrR (cupin superfamily)
MNDLFVRPKASSECLSAWQISRCALDELPGVERLAAAAHLEVCEHCRQRLEVEAAGIRAAACERIPERLTAFDRSPRPSLAWLWRPAGALAAAAAVFVALVLVPDSDRPVTRAKGEVPVSVAVMRDGAVSVVEVAFEKLEDVRPGDRLRLRIHEAQDAWVVLQGFEHRQWVDYYAGSLPKDQWLPVGVGITPDGRTRLRVAVCSEQPGPGGIDDSASRGTCKLRLLEL